MDNNASKTAFFVAPFAIDGSLIGLGEWQIADLSPKWLGVCEQLLRDHGPSFCTTLGQMLDHIEIKLTSARGAGLGAFSVHGHVATSTACFRGEDAGAEGELMKMFIDSLCRTAVVRQAQATTHPFAEMTKITARPLHVVVAWANAAIADEDQRVVAELATRRRRPLGSRRSSWFK
jgi:hypothetical protein